MLFYNILPKSKYFVALTSLVATVSCPLQATSSLVVGTGVLSVSATIADSCTVTSTGLLFADLKTQQDLNNLASSEIRVTCTAPKAGIGVFLDNGDNFFDGSHHMKDPSISKGVAYSLYTDENRQEPVASGFPINSAGIEFDANVEVVLPIYGTVEAGVYGAGNYSDTVTITVSYPAIIS